MALLPVILLNGTTADANDVMADFNEIYTNIDETNVAVGNKTGSGKFVLQTSATLTTPTINTPVISSPSISNPTITGNLNLNSGADLNIYSDVSTTLKFTVDGATGRFGIPATIKFNLDGTDLLGDTSIRESAANVFTIETGGTDSVSFRSGSLAIPATNQIFLDGISAAGSTSIRESSSGVITFKTGGTDSVSFSTSYIGIPATNRFNFDGVDGLGDTYIIQTAPDILDVSAGNVLSGRFTIEGFTIQPTLELILDGGDATRTSIRESSSNVITLKTGSTDSVSFRSGSVSVVSGNQIFMDGIAATGDTSIRESAANVFTVKAGGTDTASFRSGSLAIPATNRLYFDGISAAGDTYLFEESANVLKGVVGGVSAFYVDSNYFHFGAACDVELQSGQALYFDNTHNTYVYSGAANLIDFYTNAAFTARIGSSGILLPAVDPPTANYINRNSGVKAYALVIGTGTGATVNWGVIDSYNVSSVSGTPAQITINWNTDFANTTYTVQITPGYGNLFGATTAGIRTLNVGSVVIEETGGGNLGNSGGGAVVEYHITAYGTQ